MIISKYITLELYDMIKSVFFELNIKHITKYIYLKKEIFANAKS